MIIGVYTLPPKRKVFLASMKPFSVSVGQDPLEMVSYQWVSLGPPCHPEISGKLTTEVGRLPGAPPVAQDFQGKNSSIECQGPKRLFRVYSWVVVSNDVYFHPYLGNDPI